MASENGMAHNRGGVMNSNSREQTEDRWIELQMASMYYKKHLRAYKKLGITEGTSLSEEQAFGMANFESAMGENAERMSLSDLTDDIAYLETA